MATVAIYSISTNRLRRAIRDEDLTVSGILLNHPVGVDEGFVEAPADLSVWDVEAWFDKRSVA
mgnify:CR=1 FL=1